MTDKPNILYIFTDQQFAGAMSCTGNPYLTTPVMDSLAKEGLLFERAYCTFPLCTPSRASMITGWMPHEADIFGNNMELKPEAVNSSLGHLLSHAGYDCAYGGKWHLPEINIPDDTYGFKRICNMNDPRLGEKCVDFIDKPRDNPFFLMVSFDNPHGIHEWTAGHPQFWGGLGDPPAISHCPPLPANHGIGHYEPAPVADERKNGIQHDRFYNADDWRRRSWAYYRLCEKVDAEIGKIINKLKADDLFDRTLIIFTSDHGDMNGSHRLEFKPFLYEEAVRVPLILAGGAVPGKSDVEKELLVSAGPDLFATVCDYAGINDQSVRRGMSLKPFIEEGISAEKREYVVAEINDVERRIQGRMIRSAEFKYIAYNEGLHREQLFHLRNDPGEMVNLAACSYFLEELEKHRSYLHEWVEETEDKFCGCIYAHPHVGFMIPGPDSYPLKDSSEIHDAKGHLDGIVAFRNKRERFKREFGYR